MLWQWGERHNGAFGFVAPTGRGLGKIEGGDNRAEPDAIAPPGRLSAAMPKGPKE